MNTFPIPAADPMPLPAPVWLLKTLLMVTFFLHLLFMSGTVGGGVIALVSAMARRKSQETAELVRKLVGILPVTLAFTITLGVAALLFVQVLYGQMLYASSILMGVAWMSVIPILIVAYYGFYWASMKSATRGLWVGVPLLLVIGFIYVNNMSLMLAPERWLAMYANSFAGLNLNIGEGSLVPRYLHMMLGAVALGGLLVVVLALRERATEMRSWMLRTGTLWFTAATATNIVVGFWFLIALRPDVRILFMGKGKLASGLLIAGLILPMGAIGHLLLGMRGRKPKRNVVSGAAMAVLTVAVMVGMRDVVRTAYLNGVFSPSDLAVSPQWSVIVIFLVLFVAGLATVAWMLRKVAETRSAKA